jgi:hypothetical protein
MSEWDVWDRMTEWRNRVTLLEVNVNKTKKVEKLALNINIWNKSIKKCKLYSVYALVRVKLLLRFST